MVSESLWKVLNDSVQSRILIKNSDTNLVDFLFIFVRIAHNCKERKKFVICRDYDVNKSNKYFTWLDFKIYTLK